MLPADPGLDLQAGKSSSEPCPATGSSHADPCSLVYVFLWAMSCQALQWMALPYERESGSQPTSGVTGFTTLPSLCFLTPFQVLF